MLDLFVEFAREADPDAELYYNDFNLEKPAKRAGVIKLVKDLQARKLRIDGTVVETNIHYPTDSSLLGDGARVLTRTLQRSPTVRELATALDVSEEDTRRRDPDDPDADRKLAQLCLALLDEARIPHEGFWKR